MTFKPFDVVIAIEDLKLGVRTGAVGTVLDVYPDGALEVEFEPGDDGDLRFFAVQPGQVRLAQHEQTA